MGSERIRPSLVGRKTLTVEGGDIVKSNLKTAGGPDSCQKALKGPLLVHPLRDSAAVLVGIASRTLPFPYYSPMRPCQALDTILNALDGIYLCLGQIFNLRRVSCTGSPVSTSTSEESANVQKQVPWSGKLDG